MKIGLVSKFLPQQDGIAIYAESLCEEYKKSKEVRIIKVGSQGSKADYLIDFSSFSLYSAIKKIVEKESLDAVHFQYIAPWYGRISCNLSVVLALRKIEKELNIPTIVTLHEVQYKPDSAGIKSKVLSWIEGKVVRYASAIIVHTPKQAEFINRKYRTGKARCIYMGIAKKGVAKKGKHVLFFGMISQGKGAKDLISAGNYLPEYKITIRGNPVTRRDEQEMKEAGRRFNIKLGWASEKEKEALYKSANIVVLPYRWGPYQSAVLHDALSYGIPTVVTKVGAVWEIVSRFKTGEIVPARNPKMLAEGIKKVFAQYKTYTRGIKKYQAAAEWKQSAKKHYKVYREAGKAIKKRR